MMQLEFALSGSQCKRCGGDREPSGSRARFPPSRDGFGQWGGMEGAVNNPGWTAWGGGGIINSENKGGYAWRGRERTSSCFGFELVVASSTLHQGVNCIYSVECEFCFHLQPELTPACWVLVF